MERQEQRKIAAAFDPRAELVRDPFNEQLVFTLSAVGAVAAVPMILLVIGAVFARMSPVVFVVISVLLEWFFIFAVGRPQMTQRQSVAWATLWGTLAAFFGVCFYYWVVLTL